MNNKIKLIISIAIAVLVFVSIYFLYNNLSKNNAPQTQLMTPQSNTQTDKNNSKDKQNKTKAPDFTVVDENDKEVKLSDYFGKPIVLNMWASWCGYCIDEMPYFQDAYESEKDVQFIMLNMTSGDNIYEARKVLRENNFTFPVLYDVKSEGAIAYGANALPMTFFIDKDGYVVTYASGALSKEALNKGIEMIK